MIRKRNLSYLLTIKRKRQKGTPSFHNGVADYERSNNLDNEHFHYDDGLFNRLSSTLRVVCCLFKRLLHPYLCFPLTAASITS